jgi:adenylate cyclase
LVGHTLITFDRGILDLVREKIIKAIIAATVLMIIVSILASFILGQRLTRPIHQLMHASRAISEGDYEFRFDNMRKDEIGRLMGSMNEMTEGLLRKEQVEQTFSRYVSPKVAKEVLKNLSKVKLGGEQVHASVIFADIVGFTSLSEKLPPDQVNKLLNEYFSHIAQVAHHYGGYIDKFIGDCVMIVFGVPEKDEKHALHATQCAVMIDMMVRMLNKEREASNLKPVKFRIGINCGMMLAGNMGSSDRMEYTVVGDAVNLSARLSSAAGPGQIYISEYLYGEIKDDSYFIIENVGPIELKGKSKSVTTYSIQDVNDEYLSEMMKVLNKYITPQRIEYA